MTLSELSIRKPVFAWMLMVALILFGAIGFQRLGISLLPDVDFPVLSISARLDGAAPEVIEKEVIDPIEEAMLSIQGLKSMSSSSRSGIASISLEFNLNKNIDIASQEVESTLSQLLRQLPKEMDPPAVFKSNPEDQPILWLGVMDDSMTQRELMDFVRNKIKDRFATVPGVAEVFLGGYVDPSLRVWLSGSALHRYALSVSDVINAIRAEHQESPAGQIEDENHIWNVRTLGEAASTEQFAELPINRRGGGPNYSPIPLKSIGRIEDGLADISRISRFNGRRAVGIGLKKQRGSNAVAVANAAKARMEEIRRDLPKGADLGVIYDSTRFIQDAVHELMFTLLLSVLLTAAVCWLFLGSWSATFNVLMAIPTSAIGTFLLLYWFGFTLNTFTLLALSLAIGIVVDDAIMVLENILRYREKGKPRKEAALLGSKEITFAAVAATASIVAIFLPVAFVEGIVGKFLYQFGVTLSVAVLLSLLEALTLTPMRCSTMLESNLHATRIGRGMDALMHWLGGRYHAGLAVALNHRWKTLGVATVVFAISIWGMKATKKEFVPAQDQSLLLLRIQTPVGSSLPYTDKKFREIETILSNEPTIDRYYISIGGFGGSDVNTGIAFLTLKAPKLRPLDDTLKRPPTQMELAERYRKLLAKVQDAKIVVQDLSQSGFSRGRGFPVEFTILGSDWDTLTGSAQKVMKEMEATKLMTDIDSNYQTGMPEIQILAAREKARKYGVSISEINDAISALVGGAYAGKYTSGGHRYDIRVRLRPEERNSAKDLSSIEVRNNRGELIPISDVVTIKETSSLQAIYRQDRERAVTVYANIAKESSQQKALEAIQQIGQKVLPSGYRIALSGSAQAFGDSFKGFIFALLLGIAIAYMILASQFNSFIHPFTVLLAMPLSFTGAVAALLLSGQSVNMYSMIGLILLMGIVKKNSILLVDFTNQLREQGHAVRTALLQAGPIRLRPILMTSIATVAGAIPPALALGPGAESRVPMAVTIIGGVIVSTFLTLFVVPCAYSLFAWRKSLHAEDTIPAGALVPT